MTMKRAASEFIGKTYNNLTAMIYKFTQKDKGAKIVY
jgi:hypothetical protein